MPVMVKCLIEPDEFAALLNPSHAEIIPIGHGRYTVEFISVDLQASQLQQTTESSARLLHIRHPPERAYLAFLADSASAPIMVNGMAVDADAIISFGMTQNSDHHSCGPVRWGCIGIDRGALGDLCRPITAPAIGSSDARVLVPRKPAIRRLRALHAATIALATRSPRILAEREASHRMEQQLLESIVDCLTGPEQRPLTSAQLRHAVLMERFREHLDNNLDCTLSLPEVCAALGVSHRTLSYCCQEFLGMPPKRYFYLRRMHMVRRALRAADRRSTTVTDIATRHGFWEFGRFSVHYRALFGETPSATLRKVGRASSYAL